MILDPNILMDAVKCQSVSAIIFNHLVNNALVKNKDNIQALLAESMATGISVCFMKKIPIILKFQNLYRHNLRWKI